jgi:hypothetical protein
MRWLRNIVLLVTLGAAVGFVAALLRPRPDINAVYPADPPLAG